MDIRQRNHHRPRSWPAVLVGVGVVIGMLWITPAGAHVGKSFNHLWNRHLAPLLTNPGTINDASNPVDWTKLKGVPAGIADGVDDTGGAPGPATDVQCNGCVTSSDLGTITVRADGVVVGGGGAENGAYVLDHLIVLCLPGEEAISWSAYWGGDLNGPSPGGGDDLELTIASAERLTNPAGQQGYDVWGGNDSGSDHSLVLQVVCLAP